MYVTRPYLPPISDFVDLLEQIWGNKQLTNNGPMVRQLEQQLSEYLGVNHLSLFNNGTIALMAAIASQELTGSVITTPFSFVATAHSLIASGLRPIFCDIDPVTYNLDPSLVESVIEPDTTAVLPVHVFGVPCDVGAFQRLQGSHGLKVIYDAAHAFGVHVNGTNVLNYGDASALSFHATKVFHTFEGGVVVSSNAAAKERVDRYRNFGFVNEEAVDSFGSNGKMSEVHAAMGLLNVRDFSVILSRREEIASAYLKRLGGLAGIYLPAAARQSQNFSYFPIIVEDGYGATRDELFARFRERQIFVRKYFFPLITDFQIYKQAGYCSRDFPNARSVANRILCLPISAEMELGEVDRVCDVILDQCADRARADVKNFGSRS